MEKYELMEKLEEMDDIEYYYNNPEFQLLYKLCQAIEEGDSDLNELTPNLVENIIDLLLDCYRAEDLFTFLERQNWNPFENFRFADIQLFDEYDNEEDLEEAKENALFVDDDEEVLVMSW